MTTTIQLTSTTSGNGKATNLATSLMNHINPNCFVADGDDNVYYADIPKGRIVKEEKIANMALNLN